MSDTKSVAVQKPRREKWFPSLPLSPLRIESGEGGGGCSANRLLVAAVASQIGGEDDGLKERLKGREGDGDGELPKILSK